MKILNIHGYNGSPHNAAYAALKENGCSDITAPAIDYASETPEKILDKLKYIITDKQIELIAGTSLGGFFASVLSAELHIPVILVNPCLMPFLHLPRLGFKGDVTPFIKIFSKLSELDKDYVSCIVGGSDDIIDTHDFTEILLNNARFRVIPDGKHSGSTLPLKDYFSDILKGYII